ncbi:GreA/GreB family elongation factor [Candidatus Woesearchaeota archaeon]|nr:GreA/GreB family elongation factor [Candidatus Woesearchaeota archaeon]
MIKDFTTEPIFKIPDLKEIQKEIEDEKEIIVTEYQIRRAEKRLRFYQIKLEETSNCKHIEKHPSESFEEFIERCPLSVPECLKKIEVLSKELKRYKLVSIPQNPQEVSISTTITVDDSPFNTVRRLNIVGDGITYPDRSEIPYSSRLVKKLLGAKKGEERKFTLEERTIHYKILSIAAYNPRE